MDVRRSRRNVVSTKCRIRPSVVSTKWFSTQMSWILFVDIFATIMNPGLTRLQTGQNMFQIERKEEKKKKKDRHIGSFQADLRVSIFDVQSDQRLCC